MDLELVLGIVVGAVGTLMLAGAIVLALSTPRSYATPDSCQVQNCLVRDNRGCTGKPTRCHEIPEAYGDKKSG